MSEQKTRLSRLTAILTQLQSKRLVTARELAEKHQVSIRTIYRDIRSLEQSGVPIITEEGRGYTLMEGYSVPPIMFTEEEANALITAEKLIIQNKDRSLIEHYQSAITKLKATMRHQQKDKNEFIASRLQIRNNSDYNTNSNYLIQLQSTVANFQVVILEYISLQNEHTKRIVEPFALYTTKGNWVLIAYCRKRQDFRAFRLDCIQQIQVTSEYFEPHDKTLEQYLEECRKKWMLEYTPDIPLTPAGRTFAMNQKNSNMQQVKIQPFYFIGIGVQTTNQHQQAATDIGLLWQRFMNELILDKIPNKTENAIYSLYTDYKSDYQDDYLAIIGCKVSSLDEIPEGMIGKSFDGGNYMKMTSRGDLTKGFIVQEWQKIWEMDLDRAYTADFEIFTERSHNPNDAEVDFLVAVK